ncbi:MAG: hypothetical protein C0402_09860 [Thermodesulfovibrio sp.]|nr:hypothetical protein [Thermodesulfovibrio sp.]
MPPELNGGYLSGKTVFVAGATGLAGSSILHHIIQHSPRTRIRASFLTTEPFILHPNIEYVCGDLMSLEECRRMVSGCECAIMAAAYTGGIRLTSTQPWMHINNNLIMNARMLEAFCAEKVRRVVYIGSASLYQEFEGHIREDELDLNKDPHAAYFGFGWMARLTEKLCQLCHERFEMEVLIARSSNIFGPYAKFDPATSNFIPAIIRKAVDGMDPFEVWGSPEVTRDVIYAEDFAKAVVMMMDRADLTFDTFNIGSGLKVTVGDVVQWALASSGHTPLKIVYASDKIEAIKYRALDCTRARDILAWQPDHTIEEGIQKTTAWWIENRSWWKR